MMLCSPQHEGRPLNVPETEIDDYADTKPHFKKPLSPEELMARDGRRTPSPDGTS